MKNFSYQLYSSRNFPPLNDTLMMLGSLGYDQVEGVGHMLENEDMTALKKQLDENGLSMSSTHVALDAARDNPDKVIAAVKTLGIKAVYVPWIDPDKRPVDAKGWADFGRELGRIGQPFTDAGLIFGWHNHDFEFMPLDDGSYPIDCMLEAADNLSFEFDVAWSVKAGADPMQWIEKYGNRITAAHLKDIAPAGECKDEDGWADLGHGIVDWQKLLPALRAAGTRFFIMEHDNPSDHERFAKRSLETAKTL